MDEQIKKMIAKISTNLNIMDYDEHFLDKYFAFIDSCEKINTIWDVCEFLEKKYGFKNTNEELEKFIISILKVNDNAQKIKLILLLTYLDNKMDFIKYLLKQGFFDFLKNDKKFFIDFFQNYRLYINKQDLHEHSYEFALYQSYQNGLDIKDFNSIYDFVDGYFAGCNSYLTLQHNIYIGYTAYIYFKILKIYFIQMLDKCNDIFQIKSFIHHCNIDELLLIAMESSNMLVKFEIVKNLLYINPNDLKLKNKNEIDDILLSFTKEEQIWDNFLRFYLKFPQNSSVLIFYLTHIFDKNDLSKYIKDIFVKNIIINQYGNIENDKILIDCILNIKNKNNKKYILQAIFDRWEKYIEQSTDYITDITTFINITPLICYYVGNFLDKKEIIDKVKYYTKEMREIENKWFANSLEQHKYFFKLLYPFFVYNSYLNDEKINKKVEELLQLNRFWILQMGLDNSFFQQTKLYFDNIANLLRRKQ